MAAPVIVTISIRLRRPGRRNNALLPNSKIGHLRETIRLRQIVRQPMPVCRPGRPAVAGTPRAGRFLQTPNGPGRRQGPGLLARRSASCSSRFALRFVTDGEPGRYATYDMRSMRKASETIGGPSANTTKATPVRALKKINIQITRTKQH